jgi:hypothetical protein
MVNPAAVGRDVDVLGSKADRPDASRSERALAEIDDAAAHAPRPDLAGAERATARWVKGGRSLPG